MYKYRFLHLIIAVLLVFTIITGCSTPSDSSVSEQGSYSGSTGSVEDLSKGAVDDEIFNTSATGMAALTPGTVVPTSPSQVSSQAQPSSEAVDTYSILGNWVVSSDYSGDIRESIFLFEGSNESGNVSNGENYSGKFTNDAGMVIKPSSGDFMYKGWFEDENNIKGTISSASTGSSRGSFTAVRDDNVPPYDIRGEWHLTATYVNGQTAAFPVLFGSGPSNVVPSTMNKGYCAISEKSYYKYSVDGKSAQWSFTSTTVNYRYEGLFKDNELFTGEIYEFNKLKGEFIMERKK